jgi:hypothetical protein
MTAEESMRNVVVLLFVLGLVSSSTAAGQARSGGAGKPAIKACSLLPKELAMKVSGDVNKRVFDLPPEEEPAGKGSACHYADITLQIDPFTAAFIDQTAKKDAAWTPVAGVGDRAWFRDNKGHYAELMGHVAGRTFTIQMGIPFQSTVEKMKPNVIALAKAIVPQLK